MKQLAVITVFLAATAQLSAQEVRTLAEGQQPGKGTLEQIQWLIGYWVGTGLGGDCVEAWLPAEEDAMQGIFRFAMNDTLIFTEYMHLIEENGSLPIKLKHFGKDLVGWEEKEEWTRFPLIAIEGQTAYFDGITYQVTENKLVIRLNLREGDVLYTEDFNFTREKL